MDSSLAAFFAISIAVIVTPGQDTALTIRNTLMGGRRGGVATASASPVASSSATVAASVGITAVLVASEPVFVAVAWPARRTSSTSGRPCCGPPGVARQPRTGSLAPTGHGSRSARALRQGFLSDLGDPKMVVIFSSLLPQFVPVGGPTFVR